jgi:hypothetical protein
MWEVINVDRLSSVLIVRVKNVRHTIQMFSKMVKNEATRPVGLWAANWTGRRWNIVIQQGKIRCLSKDLGNEHLHL